MNKKTPSPIPSFVLPPAKQCNWLNKTWKYLRPYYLFFLLALCPNNVFASHIVGGDITVAYTGVANTFNVTVTVFRDNTSGTALENSINIGVYDKATNVLQQTITLSNPTLTLLTLGTPCYTPALAIQKGVYVTTNVVIASNINGYYLSYLRCCRNAAITNIVNPSNEGFVAYCEIPNPALGNSSPVFNTNPDGYMCRNYVNSDAGFGSTDANGDVLVYSFSTPLSCVGTGQCDATINVNPGAAAGPYGAITWGASYSLTNPMGDPFISINSSNGTITTTPPNLGVYVFCVKVEEYRAGVKIGEIRRDFQFDVLSCSNLNITATPGNPVCLGTQSTLAAIGASSAFTYSWAPGGATTSAITVNPGSAGTYNYTVTATNAACISVTTTALVVNPVPTATAPSSGNPCLGQNMTLTAAGGSSYSWSNGVVSAAMSTATPGTYTVTVTNSYNCTAITTGVINAPISPSSTFTWTGAGSNGVNDWFDSNNWGNSYGCLPTCASNVIIPNVANDPDIGTASGAAACNSITINQGGKLSFSSATSELDICGDFIDNGVTLTFPANGVLKFMGSVPQNFTKSNTASGNDFNKIILANTASLPTLTLKEGVGYKDLSLGSSGTFVFQSGILVTEGSRALYLKNTASTAISGYGPSSYVFGRIQRNIVNNTSYDFPVGGNPVGVTVYPYELMTMSFTSISTTGYVTVCFDNPNNSTGNTTTGYNGLPLTEQTGQYNAIIDNGGSNTGVGYPSTISGVWTVIPDAGAPTYNMTLYGRNFDNSNGAGTYYSVVKRNSFSMCSTVPSWSLDGAIGASSLVSNVITAQRTGMVGYSQFGIARHTTPLPVELLLFDATCANHNTVLSWVTASETNNDFFTLERSCDENSLAYQTIATIPGAGSSSTVHNYSFTDKELTAGNCYFRLSQTDFNGTTIAFPPVSINCNENAAFNLIGVLPNPAEKELFVFFSTDKADVVSIRVTDVVGKQLLVKEITPEIGLNKIDLDVSQYTGGVYFVSVDNGTKSFTKKVIKKD